MVPNIPVGPNQNGSFHLTSARNFRKCWLNGKHPRIHGFHRNGSLIPSKTGDSGSHTIIPDSRSGIRTPKPHSKFSIPSQRARAKKTITFQRRYFLQEPIPFERKNQSFRWDDGIGHTPFLSGGWRVVGGWWRMAVKEVR